MSKSDDKGCRLGNPKKREENRSRKREIKKLLKEERFDELELEEFIIPIKEEEDR